MEQYSFQEVMKQWRRRCEACEKNEPVECNIGGYVCDEFCKMQKHHIDPEFVERDVMTWAAKHPESVYPTWYEWLADQGMVDVARIPDDYYGGIVTEIKPSDKMHERIPADIAEKLGLQPKEESTTA